MLPQEIILAKRDGATLSDAMLRAFARGIADESVSEAQAAAFCMAVLFRGMTSSERVAYTLALRDSGVVLDWRADHLGGPVLDKHSTGGLGDKTSLLLAPMVAACGGFVPLITGRGLGHTGGTVDKMEAIPGYRARPGLDALRTTIREVGCAIVGATADLAPADRRLYAIRDVTATVESFDLICGSILSKKLAAGPDALVLDVKYGSGAFIRPKRDALRLTRILVEVAQQCGLPTVALLTDMNEVLGTTAGNALEVMECLEVLTTGKGDERLITTTVELGAELLVLGKLAANRPAARRMLNETLANGAAADRFQRMVAALGGPPDLLEKPRSYLASAPVRREIHAPEAGHLLAIDLQAVGYAIVAMGGGRVRTTDIIDPSVGLSDVAAPGAKVGPGGRPLCIVHAAGKAAASQAQAAILAAMTVGPMPKQGVPAGKNPIAARIAER